MSSGAAVCALLGGVKFSLFTVLLRPTRRASFGVGRRSVYHGCQCISMGGRVLLNQVPRLVARSNSAMYSDTYSAPLRALSSARNRER